MHGVDRHHPWAADLHSPDPPPGAHALSYGALEWASYDLFERIAERAGEPGAADMPRSIRDEERAMMRRIEALFDATVEASLRDVPRDGIQARLRVYLAEVRAIEARSLELLESGRGRVEPAPTLARISEAHLQESARQRSFVEARLQALGGDRSLRPAASCASNARPTTTWPGRSTRR